MAAKNTVKYISARRKTAKPITFCVKRERNALFKKVTVIVQKPEQDVTEEEKEVLRNCSELVKEVKQRLARRQRLKDRLQELEDAPCVLGEKCGELAAAVATAHRLVVYTGAGISTAARIPDYRGSNGIWTLLQQGKDVGRHDLTQAEPTLTHMALVALHRAGVLKHVVSQNCDGLHLRSGLPRQALSEVHGNMYIEVCRSCKPAREYLRLFDVTEHTARFSHRTRRRCYVCATPLVDTIVHFGERGTLQWPLNWSGACRAADGADVILCLGSSLKVLKKYSWLWGMDRPVKKRPKLYIVNLQWTPKDEQAVLKINGKCDEVMRQVMEHLQIAVPSYSREGDPIFTHTTGLHPAELHTTSHPQLAGPDPAKQEPVAGGGFHFVSVELDQKPGARFEWSRLLDPFRSVAARGLGPEETITGVSSVFDRRPDLSGEGGRRFLCCPNKLVSRCQCDVGPCHQETALDLTVRGRDATCPFCVSRHGSASCLFYVPRRPEFKILLLGSDPDAAICECCDRGSEEGETGAEDEEDSDVAGEDLVPKQDDESPLCKVPAVNPGWYGKGCRKKIRRKRAESRAVPWSGRTNRIPPLQRHDLTTK
ncbi:NAD-dependent protein deacetylase Sirt7 [Bacillus rossius redtenbacheri]|uniref:NAD-dependent protein deacetylase Sirt7 n=1 Tax=Bacillus rossius redtenbacheri TaxID=93214 RepID=UPI002FDDB038